MHHTENDAKLTSVALSFRLPQLYGRPISSSSRSLVHRPELRLEVEYGSIARNLGTVLGLDVACYGH